MLGYLMQAWPRFLNRYFGVDVWRNLCIANYIREHKCLPKYLPRYMLKGFFDYPPLFNIVLSFLPKKFLERNQGFISPVFDAVLSFTIFYFTKHFTQSLTTAVIAQVLYIFSPLIVIENASLTARSLGALLFLAAFLTLLLYSKSHTLYLMAASIIFISLTLFAQKMASQALFFMCAIFSLWEKDFLYLIFFIIAVIVALIVSKGFYLRVLQGQISVYKYFRQIIDVRYAHQIRGISPAVNSPDFIDKIKAVIKKFPLFALTASYPLMTLGFLVSLDLLFFKKVFLVPHNDMKFYAQISRWIFCLYAMGFITAYVKPLRFLGEGNKYLVYGGFPVSFLLAEGIYKFGVYKYKPYFIVLVVIAVFVSLGQIIFLQKKCIIEDKQRTITPALRKTIEHIKDADGMIKLASVPFSLADAVAYFTEADVLSSDSAHVLGNSSDYLDYYPTLRRPLEEILEKHRINYLLIDTNYVRLDELNLKHGNIDYKSDNYLLIKR